MRLLVVDFDYFFPVPQDPRDPLAPLFAWAHFETPYYLLEAWEERALAFLLRGLSLPEARGWEGFWGRFAFAREAVLYYAESNALAFHPEVRRGVEEVVLFDAHHDAGYRPLGEEPACDDWWHERQVRFCGSGCGFSGGGAGFGLWQSQHSSWLRPTMLDGRWATLP